MKKQASLDSLSDEFTDPAALSRWKHVYREEGTGANQLEKLGVRDGHLLMVPHASTWYKDYRGVLLFKPVSGNFVVTTQVQVSGRRGGAPQSPFSLAGLMVRAWRPGGENYVFLSLGAADRPGTFQLEVKTTVNSDSQLQLTPAESGTGLIQVARLGSLLVMLKNQGRGWSVHRRYERPDFPTELQVGLTCYTDWPSAERLSPQQHNTTVLTGGNPDLSARFDFVRFRRPQLPPRSAPARLSDSELLRFLGDAAL